MKAAILIVSVVAIIGGCGCSDRPVQQPATVAAVSASISPAASSSNAARWENVPLFQVGRAATASEIAAWDLDVRPDGRGLPPGRGTARAGAAIYAVQSAACHGQHGEGATFDRLAAAPRKGFPYGRDDRVPKTVGTYWPYATTLYDYIQRSMPQYSPSTLTPDDTYAVTAYVLFLNQLWPEDAELNAQTLPAITMPARDRFVLDNRRGGPEIR